MILFDLASLPPREGEGQVSELHVIMSNPIFDSLHLKWPSFEIIGRLKWVSNGRTFDFLMLRMRPLASFSILVSVSWMNGMSDCISLCHMSLHLLCILVFVFLLRWLHWYK